MRTAWQLYDPVTLVTVSLDINPNDGGTPGLTKAVNSQSTVAPDGLPIFYQGNNEPQMMEFSGFVYEEEQLDVLLEWAAKNRIILITDDLARAYRVMVTSFIPKRIRRSRKPYYHSYTMTAMVMS